MMQSAVVSCLFKWGMGNFQFLPGTQAAGTQAFTAAELLLRWNPHVYTSVIVLKAEKWHTKLKVRCLHGGDK